MVRSDRKSKKARQEGAQRTERKRSSHGWFSLDSLMGKVLCVLLVVILTVGAFLAPKVINNLYDAGTLMQITYMDMDLSPYAVNYVTIEDKLQAIARVKTAGGSLSVLPAGEEASGGISDAELTEAVNKEMGELSLTLSIFFSEGWWSMLTEENLMSRTKYTLYGRPEEGEGDTSREMAPFQFWVLQFARVETYDEKKAGNKYLAEFGDATDRIIVCMDADFYKVYAFAFAGNTDMIVKQYGWELSEIFDAGYQDGYVMGTMSAEARWDMRVNLTKAILEGWAEYWDTVPEEQAYYMDAQDELTGLLIYRESADVEVTDEDTDIGKAQGSERYLYNYDTGEVSEVMISPEDNIEASGIQKGDMLLVAGAQGQAVWGEADFATWTQKTGCMDFLI